MLWIQLSLCMEMSVLKFTGLCIIDSWFLSVSLYLFCKQKCNIWYFCNNQVNLCTLVWSAVLYKESLKTLKASGIACWQLLSLPGGVRVSILARTWRWWLNILSWTNGGNIFECIIIKIRKVGVTENFCLLLLSCVFLAVWKVLARKK